jgi:hypothetical protein
MTPGIRAGRSWIMLGTQDFSTPGRGERDSTNRADTAGTTPTDLFAAYLDNRKTAAATGLRPDDASHAGEIG